MATLLQCGDLFACCGDQLRRCTAHATALLRPQGNLHWGGIRRLLMISKGSTGTNKKYKVLRSQVYIRLTT